MSELTIENNIEEMKFMEKIIFLTVHLSPITKYMSKKEKMYWKLERKTYESIEHHENLVNFYLTEFKIFVENKLNQYDPDMTFDEWIDYIIVQQKSKTCEGKIELSNNTSLSC